MQPGQQRRADAWVVRVGFPRSWSESKGDHGPQSESEQWRHTRRAPRAYCTEMENQLD